MSFATALSGLKAASTSLQVTGNNIANSQTTGFKQSRAEFADVYASSLGGVSRTQAGSGVRVTEVAQQFNDGNIESTQNSLDLAISGNGFFVLADTVNLPDPADKAAPVDPSVPSAYTRNGAFQLNSVGNVVNDKGQYLLAFAANGTTAAEGFSTGVFRPITVDTSQGLPSATTDISLKLTINGGAVAPTAVFSPTDPKSYNNTTSVTTYDSQGNAHVAATYYVKTPVANVWDAYLFIDNYGITTGGQAVPPNAAPKSTVSTTVNTPGLPIPMKFSSTGLLEEVGARAASTVSAEILTGAKAVATSATAASDTANALPVAITAENLLTAAESAVTNIDDGVAAATNVDALYTPARAASAVAKAQAALDAATAMKDAAASALTFVASGVGLGVQAQAAVDAATAAVDAAQTYRNSAGNVNDAATAATALADANAAATAIAAAKTTADAYMSATGAVSGSAQAAADQALAAASVAKAAAVVAAAVNSNPAVAAAALDANTKAATAALSAAAYATEAALVTDGASATAAIIAANKAASDAADAQLAAKKYDNALKAAAADATQASKVDFGAIDLSVIDPNLSVDPMAFGLNFAETTQLTSPFSVGVSSQNGLPAGNLTGIDVDDAGVVFAKYSNGGSKALGQVALARFPSNQSLAKLGDTTWGKTANSGTPVYGAAGDNNFGGIQSSALEGSNVDLSDQLVKLIIQQQAYQANSQTITTEKTLVDTILRA
ncbi:MAG: flagellar hook-basal body complex protein [Methylococcaceae bacterium]